MRQLSIYDYIQGVVVKDVGEVLADEITDKVCNFIESNVLKHCFPLENKKVEFGIWDHVKHLGRKLSIGYRFEHNWEYNSSGGFKCVSDDDVHIDKLIFERNLIKELEATYKGISCSIYIIPGMLNFYIENIDKAAKNRSI